MPFLAMHRNEEFGCVQEGIFANSSAWWITVEKAG